MSLKIKLFRRGKSSQPSYRIRVKEHLKRRFVEDLGYYRPVYPEAFNIDLERYSYWISKGAQPSDKLLWLINRQ